MSYIMRFARHSPALLRSPSAFMTSTSVGARNLGQEFFEKNSKLQRPLSPHLTIYAPQLTSMLSITHRFTGCGLAIFVYGLGIGPLLASQQFPYYMEAMAGISPAVTMPIKLVLATSLSFHLVNGIRHLAWDMGYGFQLKQLYTSGYAVLAVSLVAGVLLAFK
ncbi:succinate dehydrogenase cytochrome b560 subunit, mitochondrial-like [Ornithodoros turicata]|uniref:succinate dehydrogenase cytochrome b560 subunit, mitochondrial-like n=1 Tax=Ornithodoros turicata TaxID=34597 RepID=UPI00313A3F96